VRSCEGDFFRLSVRALVAKIWPGKVMRWCADGEFLRPVYSASCVQHISDLHSTFGLRPHHGGSMVDIESATAEIRRGKKKKIEDRRNHRAKI